MKKGSGTFFVYRRFCERTTRNSKRAKAGYHYDGGILPFVLRDQVRLVRTWSPPYMAHWGQSLHTCVPGRACTPLARCNTLDFVPKSVCQGAVSRLSVRSSASKCKHFEVATGDPRPLESLRRVYARTQKNDKISLYRGCSFIGEYGILGLVQQIRSWQRS